LGSAQFAHLTQVCNAQHKTDGVQDVGLSTAIQARDGVEVGIKIGHHDPLGVRLEALDGDFLDVHAWVLSQEPLAGINSSFPDAIGKGQNLLPVV